MKTRTDGYGLLQLELEEKDLQDARQIRLLMLHPGWKILQDYWAVARETMIEKGKALPRSRAKKDLSPFAWAALNGFDECAAMPLMVVARADQHIENEKQKLLGGGENGEDGDPGTDGDAA